MRLKFKGMVETGNYCRVADDGKDGAIHIGGVDVVAEMSSHSGRFTFAVADQTFDGDLFVSEGWGYSEWTPMDSDELKVGDHDLIEILRRYEGQEITLFVFNEPSNIINDSEWLEVKAEQI